MQLFCEENGMPQLALGGLLNHDFATGREKRLQMLAKKFATVALNFCKSIRQNIGAGIAAPACTAKTAGKNVPGLQPVGRGNLITQRTRAFSPNVFKGSHLRSEVNNSQ